MLKNDGVIKLGNLPLPIARYKDLAEELDLILQENQPVGTIAEPVFWECKLCGQVVKKSYKKLKYRQTYPCKCRWKID